MITTKCIVTYRVKATTRIVTLIIEIVKIVLGHLFRPPIKSTFKFYYDIKYFVYI